MCSIAVAWWDLFENRSDTNNNNNSNHLYSFTFSLEHFSSSQFMVVGPTAMGKIYQRSKSPAQSTIRKYTNYVKKLQLNDSVEELSRLRRYWPKLYDQVRIQEVPELTNSFQYVESRFQQ